jgi:BirA family transcriptional regulator, biotin operon repressor / biotin---[acetyl-CoA-carboxylase] ligase
MKEYIIRLLKKNDFISGEEIAKHFGVSRTAVWKHIDTLRKQGYRIDSIKNKGYRLVSKPDILLPFEIQEKLHTNIIGKKIQYFPTIHSTNTYAKQIIKQDIKDGTVIVSDIQTEGRGRKNRSWQSTTNGLWFSIILFPNLTPNNGMLLTMASSISIVQGIKEITGLNPIIKWPNDVLIENKKVCGILTEINAEMDKINYAIIGIGINVNNQIDTSLEDIAISLKIKVGSPVSRLNLLSSILNYMDQYYNQINKGDFFLIRNKWLEYSGIIGRKIIAHDEKTTYQGIVTDIDDSGCIILKTTSGIHRILSGDIEYI